MVSFLKTTEGVALLQGGEAVTLGHKGADTAFHPLGGARDATRLGVGTKGLKRANVAFGLQGLGLN